jgi:hypothetical protein
MKAGFKAAPSAPLTGRLFLNALLGALLVTGCSSPTNEKSGQVPANAAPTTAQPVPEEKSKTLLESAREASGPTNAFEGEGWKSLFNGSDMSGWQEVSFGGGGEVEIGSGILLLNMGEPFTGIRYTNEFPTGNYEIAFDAMRAMGSDFFCGLTVPVEDSHCSLILGGWGGSLVGISSVNGMDASENETTKFEQFQKLRWYRIRMRVTKDRVEAWVDKNKVVDLVTKNQQLSLRPGEIELCKPLGIATWQTAAAFRNFKWRTVETAADPPPKRL